MPKGFGFYSSDETTTFLMKAMLLSFWIGIDITALLVGSTFSAAELVRHGILTMCVLAVLIGGTVFSALFVWATGSLSSATEIHKRNDMITSVLHKLKQQPQYLIGAGALATSLLLLFIACGIAFVRQQGD